MTLNKSRRPQLPLNMMYLLTVLLFFISMGGCTQMTIAGGNNIIQPIGTIRNERGEGVDVIRWHPDSRHIAVTSPPSLFIYVWDAKSRNLVKKLDKSPFSGVEQLTYTSDGKYLISRDPYKGEVNAIGNRPGHFLIWSVADNYRLIDDSHKFDAYRFLFPAPDGRILSYESGPARSKDPKISFSEIPSMKRHDFHQYTDGPDTLSFSPDGHYLAEGYKTREKEAASWDDKHHLRLWKYPEMELVWDNKEVHQATITAITFSPNGKFIVTGPASSDKKTKTNKATGESRELPYYHEPMKLWEYQAGRFIRDITSLKSPLERLYFLDEKHLLGIDIWRKIIVWDFETGQELAINTISADPYVFTAELSPDKKTLAFGKEDTILLFEFKLPHKK